MAYVTLLNDDQVILKNRILLKKISFYRFIDSTASLNARVLSIFSGLCDKWLMGNNYECRFTKISGNTLTCWSACSARPWPISFKMELEEDCLQESQYRRRLFPRTLSLSLPLMDILSVSLPTDTLTHALVCSRTLKHSRKHSHTHTHPPTHTHFTHTHTYYPLGVRPTTFWPTVNISTDQ